MLPAPLLHWREQAPHRATELGEDCNHYTILMPDGPAAVIAKHLTGE